MVDLGFPDEGLLAGSEGEVRANFDLGFAMILPCVVFPDSPISSLQVCICSAELVRLGHSSVPASSSQ